jgi:hypothetical protein
MSPVLEAVGFGLITLVGGALVTAAASTLRERAALRSADPAGDSVPAAGCPLGRHPWRDRWRHGSITLRSGDLHWRSGARRPGAPIVVPAFAVVGRRPARWHENLWLEAGSTVVTVRSMRVDGRQYQVGLSPTSLQLMAELRASGHGWVNALLP